MGLVDFAIRRRVTIAMATVAITLLGMISLSRLKVNLHPDLSYPTLTIRTELPGAAPEDVHDVHLKVGDVQDLSGGGEQLFRTGVSPERRRGIVVPDKGG